MDKDMIRERVWDDLDDRGIARFPFPPHGRIPNFAGADRAADRLTTQAEWTASSTIKSNPDAPQLPVRRAALRAGKLVYMAVPRLREEHCFLRLAPGNIEDIDHATTVGGSSEVGESVHPSEVNAINLIVTGCVAVTTEGHRIGKGEGYSDLEFVILQEFGLVDDETTTVTTVRERQVIDESVDFDAHDVPMDLIVTPDRVIETAAEDRRPNGIDWDALSPDRIAEIPILASLRPGGD